MCLFLLPGTFEGLGYSSVYLRQVKCNANSRSNGPKSNEKLDLLTDMYSKKMKQYNGYVTQYVNGPQVLHVNDVIDIHRHSWVWSECPMENGKLLHQYTTKESCHRNV